MVDFAKLLSDKMKKATEANRGAEKAADSREPASLEPEPVAEGSAVSSENTAPAAAAPAATRSAKKANPFQNRSTLNTNRITVNLFDADRRALAVVKEHLANAGHDFTNRSDCIKIALRLAAKAKKEDLSQLFLEVRAEDRRYSSGP